MPIEQVHGSPPCTSEHAKQRIADVMILNGKELPSELQSYYNAFHDFTKKEKTLGLVHRHGLITRVNYDSPFKGLLMTGDIILMVDGQEVSFEKTTATADKSVVSFMCKMKTTFRRSPSSTPTRTTNAKDFKTLIRNTFAKPDETIKIVITVMRLKARSREACQNTKNNPGTHRQWEGVKIFQYKFLKLGLNMQQVEKKVYVNYTFPDTVANTCLSIGETIFSVDDKTVETMENVKQWVLEGCKERGYAKLIVEFPNVDPDRNMIRQQLFEASKVSERIQYLLAPDVCEYLPAGVQALKTAKEPTPILREVKEVEKKKSVDKELEKKKSADKGLEKKKSEVTQPPPEKKKIFKNGKEVNVEFREKTEEHDIPSEWNTRLFVFLPAMKTKETECPAPPSTTSKK